ncbi:MAG: hypothetical protein FIA99_08230 [Ruminiclostridium sp.]|nr:hypothetical protein [Ruminiclostridium sp.]
MEYMKLLSSAAVQPNNGIIKQHGHSMKIIYILLSILLILINPVSATTIMPLGDSITAESDSYRIKLLSLLSENGYNPVFVGSLSDATSRHEGHWGWRSYQISWNTASFISANPADNVLLHIGTNDVTYARTQGFTSPYDYAYAKPLLKEIVADIHNVSPDTKIFVSTIIPQKNCMYINETYYCGLTDLVKDYNSMIKDTANEMIMSGLPVYLVEMENAGIDVNIDLKDSVHPNILGSDKMAYVWYNAIQLVPILLSSSHTLKNITMIKSY